MTIVNLNFNNVPDEDPPVAEGVYLCEIQEEPTVEQKSGGQMIAARMIITDECDDKGRMLFANHCIWTPLGARSLKKMIISAGLTPSEEGIDLAEFVGTLVKVLVKHEMYTPKEEGAKPRLTAQVKQFIAPE